jgi:hypothetical protein
MVLAARGNIAASTTGESGMRKEVCAGVALAFIGLGVATPAFADPWEACVIGACLKDYCGPNDATVIVTAPIDLADPAVMSSTTIRDKLSAMILARGMPSGAQSNCAGPFPSEAAAAEKSTAIYQNMRNSFSDVTMVSASQMFDGYGRSSSVASSSQYSSDDSSSSSDSSSESAGSDDGAAAAAQQAEAQAAREREREAMAQRARNEAAAVEAERQKREAALAEAQAAAQRDREARQKALAELQAKNSNDDANQCVSGATLRENDTFQGNTAAYVSNGCGRPVDVRICLMTEAKGWNCGMTYGLSPQSSWSWSSMHATGQVFQDARISGSQRTMQSP